MNKSQLGFACGKTCPNCGEPVALDCFGRYTCFTDAPECGGHVKLDETPGKLKLRKVKNGQVEFFAQESALLKMIRGE